MFFHLNKEDFRQNIKDNMKCLDRDLLHMVCLYNNSLYVKLLLDIGFSPNTKDNIGQIPLHKAVLYHFPGMIRYIKLIE